MYWIVNLIILWIVQFSSSCGFSLSLPFAPYYIQDLGVTDPAQVTIWTTIVTAIAPLTMAVFSPVWGNLADRHGRKAMILRATIGGAIALCACGMAGNVYLFTLFRFLQGMFTGVATAIITLIACNTPENRQGMALSFISAALFSGNICGMFAGGFLADMYGYANSFFLSGGVLLFSALLTLFVKEKFTPPREEKQSGQGGLKLRFLSIGPAVFLLAIMLGMSVIRRMDGGMLAIFIQDLYGGLDGVSVWGGAINAAGGIGALVSGACGSLLIDKCKSDKLLTWVTLGSAGGCLLLASAWSCMVLLPYRFIYMIFAAGFDPVLNTWISKVTPPERKGTAFGFAQTAKSIGMTLGPVLGGAVALVWDARAVFFAAAGFFLLLIPLKRWALKHINNGSSGVCTQTAEDK